MARRKKSPTDPAAIAQAQRAREEQEVQTAFQKGITALRDFIAPSSLEFKSTHFQLGTRYARTYYVYGYPRQLYTGWLSSMVNLDEVMDLALYIYPVESQIVLESLRKKVTQLEAGIQIDTEKGRVRDPGKQAAILDAEEIRDKLQVGEERFFRFGFYFTFTPAVWRSWSLSAIRWNRCSASNWSTANRPAHSRSKGSTAPCHSWSTSCRSGAT